VSTLEEALGILCKEYGDLDNVKFLLGDGEGMSVESVAEELLSLAQQTANGTLKPVEHFAERTLASATIEF